MQLLYENIDIFLLILVRMLGFFMILPILSGSNIPTTARISLAVFMSYLLVSSQTIDVTYNPTLINFSLLVMKEFLVGFIIAFVVYVIFAIIYFAGQIIDYQIGFSMVSVFDPVSQIQVPITGNFIYFIICAFMIQTGGLHTIINSIFQSYILLPVGEAIIVNNEKLILYIVDLLIAYFTIGVKISMPILGSILILDVALGILVKAAPQMNIFVVGIPIKIIVGFAILTALVATFYITLYDMLFYEAMKAVSNIIRGMSP